MKIENVETRFSILVIMSNKLFRAGLAQLFADTRFDIQREASSIAEAFNQIAATVPDLVIFDTPGEKGLVEDIRDLRSHLPSSRIVVLTSSVSTEKIASVLKAGADAYLNSDMSQAAFVQSLELTMLGEKVFPTRLAGLLIEGYGGRTGNMPDAVQLSEIEKKILKCLVAGDSNKGIARRLDLGEAAVKVQLRSLLRRIHVANRTQAAIWAMGRSLDAAEKPSLADGGAPARVSTVT